MALNEWKIAESFDKFDREQDKWNGKGGRTIKMADRERVLTSVSGGQAAASWPCTGCLPAAG